MTTTLETSLPLPVLIAGAVGSIVLFLFLFRQERTGLGPVARWMIPGLRIVLCLLVWFLIAQPKAVTTREETLPVTTRLGVDVSASMSLVDQFGEHTDRWREGAEILPLEEATALAEAAKVRLHLQLRRNQADRKAREQAIAETRELLDRVAEAIRKLESTGDLERLVQPPLDAVLRASEALGDTGDTDRLESLGQAAQLASQAATGLRRVAQVLPTPEAAEGTPQPRIDLVNRWMTESDSLFEDLEKSGEVEVFTFASTLARSRIDEPFTSGDALGETTNLYRNLDRMAAEDRVGGRQLSLLVTDGMDSTPPETWALSAAVRDQPLLVLPVGDPSTAPDVFIESVVSPARVREEDTFVARVELGTRHLGRETLSVSLVDGGTVLDQREVDLEGAGQAPVLDLEWTAEGLGSRDLRIEVSSVEGEVILANNQWPTPCQVTRDQYRVLVCDGKPRWETRYLQNLFKRDASIEMESLVFAPRHAYPGKPLPPMPALPLALELWQQFDLVILGDVQPRQLTPDHQSLLVDYVDGGGNLLILAGDDAMPSAYVDTPLEPLLPMTRAQGNALDGIFVVQPPEDRSLDPMVQLAEENGQPVWKTLFSITPQFRLSAWARAKESARLLLVAVDQQSGTTHDFLALQRFGRGRVAFAAAPCLFHLRSNYGDRYHARFWGQMIRGICADNFGFEGGLIQTRLDRSLWGAGAEIQGRVRLTTPGGLPMTDADFSALLIDGEGVPVARMRPIPDPDRPGDYFVRFPDAKPGRYLVEYKGDLLDPLLESDRGSHPDDSARKLIVTREGFSRETQPSAEPSPFWNRINELPLAATVTPKTLPLVIDALDLEPEQTIHTSKRPLWNAWWCFLAIVLVSGLEWLLRRTNGLC